MQTSYRPIQVIKYAGALAAYMMGPGFATGQEILQFFTVYGFWSMGGLAIVLLIFISLTVIVAKSADLHRNEPNYIHYTFFTNQKIGVFLHWFGILMVVLVYIVIVAGAGTTIEITFGVPYEVGCAIISALSLGTYLLGVNRLVNIIGCIGPVAICIIIAVAVFALQQFGSDLSAVPDLLPVLSTPAATDYWWLSGVLYISCCFFFPSLLITELVRSAPRPKEAMLGCCLGCVAFTAGLFAINLGLLTTLQQVNGMAVPTLTMTQAISPLLGSLFSVLLLCMVYGSASSMMWTAIQKLTPLARGHDKPLAVVIALLSLTSGLFPFEQLVNILYPYMGLIGLIFVAGVYFNAPTILKRQSETAE